MRGTDAVRSRTVTEAADGDATNVRDAYFYFHPKPDKLHYLALSNSGAVDEGELKQLAESRLEVELTRYEDDRVVRLVERFDVEKDGTLRARTWTVEGDTRTLRNDAHLTKNASK